MASKSDNSDNVKSSAKAEKDASTSEAAANLTMTMNGLQQAAWPFLAGAGPNALLQSYAKLAFPDFDQAAVNNGSSEPQSPSRVPMLPPFAVPPSMFVTGTSPLVPQFGPLGPSLMQSDNPLMLPPGTQLDPSTLAAITAAAAAYQQMNAGGAMCQFDFPGGARRKNATRETTSTLKAWLHEHRKNPYPTKAEKIMLAILTRMSLTQVSTWFANARRRLKKESKMNSWASQQQARADGAKHSAGHGLGHGNEDSENSACDDNDNMDFDADSIDIDGECASDGEQPVGTKEETDEDAHPDCRQCSSRTNDCNAEQLSGNNNNAQNGQDKAQKSAAALSVDTCFSKLQAEGSQLDAATLLRHSMLTNKLLQQAAESSRPDDSAGQSQAAEKSKFWSLVDTATSPQSSSARKPDCSDMQSPQVQEFVRNFLAFSAKMHAAVAGVGADMQQGAASLPSMLPQFAHPEFTLNPELLAHGASGQNLHGDPFANAAALYLNMIKQKALV